MMLPVKQIDLILAVITNQMLYKTYECDRFNQSELKYRVLPKLTNYFKSISFLFALVLITDIETTVSAQIVPDTTLPQNTVVTPDGNAIEITGGTIEGSNLFHSFQEFSVLNGETAFFDNASTITNIIGRITGSSVSEIDGLIRANGTADLFLINPNGIIFGENAALDLGGSFIGSTADSINFADGAEFSAVDPNASPLLTVSIPAGLQYGRENGDLTVKGTGNNLFIDFDTFTVDRCDRPSGLEVQSEKTLALVGGNIFLEGGNLTAPQGNIELGSVTEGTVQLTPNDLGWKLGYESADGFQEIGLSQAASLEASGSSGGRVTVKGGFVSLTDGSAILTDTLGDGSGGSLTIEAEEAEIYGAAENGFTSSLFNNVDLGATGGGGNTLIDTGYLYIGDGAQVNVNTFDVGNAGTLTITAGDIEILGGSTNGEFPSGLFAQADIGETGKGGEINIEADYLLVADGAQVSTTTFGEGAAGDLSVRATEIELIAGSADFGSSGLFVSSEDLGDGGNLTIDTDYLLVADGAVAQTSTFFNGDAGNLEITANTIELIGTSPNGLPSGLFSTAEAESGGMGGNIAIATENLLVKAGAQIAVSTAGFGNGGFLNIEASQVKLANVGELGSSGLFSNAIIGSGDGGDINLTSDKPNGMASLRLSITDGATISASNFSSRNSDIPPGTGAAGSINLNVDSLELDSTGEEFSSITASTFAQTGGDITLNVNSNLNLNNGSRVTAETRGEGDGGNINVAANQFNLNNQGQVSVNSTGLGQAGDITVAANSLNLDRGKITATSTQSGGGEIDLVTDSITLDNNSLISTSVLDSTGGGGNILIDNRNFIIGQNDSNIRADAVLGAGGNIQIYAQGIFFDVDSEITASSEFGVDGIVEIDTTESDKLGTVSLPSNISTPEAVIISSCPVPESNTFVVLGASGLPENPQQYLRGQTTWQDVRRFSDRSSNPDPNQGDNSLSVLETSERIPTKSIDSKSETIVESQSWIINHKGNIELIANAVPITPQSSWQPTVECRF